MPELRMELNRRFSFGIGLCVFIMLNPSTADETHDDPTVKRCIAFAKSWGYGRLRVLNTNPWRSTDPKAAPLPNEVVLASNDEYIKAACRDASVIVCAWGTHVVPALESRVLELLAPYARAWPGLVCHLGLTKHGHPKHPLYLPGSLKPTPWMR